MDSEDIRRSHTQAVLSLLEDYTVVGTDPLLALVPRSAPDAFVKGVKASAISSQMGIGLGYALDRYVDPARRDSTDPSTLAFREVYFLGKRHMDSTLERMEPLEEPTAGESYADSALRRLAATYFSAGLLFRTGHLFEARTLCRLFLEQVAWSYAASHKRTYEAASRVSPSGSIARLKEVVPWVGPLYGELSEDAHLDLDGHLRFLRFTEPEAQVLIAHGKSSLLSGTVLLKLADLWAVTYEWSQRRHYSELENWAGSTEGLELREDRPFVARADSAIAALHDSFQ